MRATSAESVYNKALFILDGNLLPRTSRFDRPFFDGIEKDL